MWPSMSASSSVSGEPSPEVASSVTRSCPCGQEALADADQEFGEHRVLAGEVAVEAGSADPHGSAYFVDAHAVEAALGEEAGSLLEDLLTACRGVRPGGHGFDSRQSG